MKVLHDLTTNEYYTWQRAEYEFSTWSIEDRARYLNVSPDDTFIDFIDRLLFEGEIEVIEVIA